MYLRRILEAVDLPGGMRLPCLLGAVAVLVAGGGATAVRADAASEYDLKGAFLVNFTAFVSWPESTPQPPRICIYGEDPFHGVLEELLVYKNSTAGFRVEQLRHPRGLRDCRVVFISRSERSSLPGIIAGLSHAPVLTITDLDDAEPADGVIINLVRQEDRIAFNINNTAAQAAGLKISSKLLTLAKSVH